MEADYESIKAKIRKLYALAEQGVAGEAQNARRILEKTLSRYGLTLEEVLGEDQKRSWCAFYTTRKWHKELLMACYYKFFNVGKITYKEGKTNIYIELSPYEFAEMASMYEWHKAQLDKDMKDLISRITNAFILKHKLYNSVENEDSMDREELTPEKRRDLLKTMFLTEGLEDTYYQKQIEKNHEKEISYTFALFGFQVKP